ncbi:MAG: multicopper oxidase domain-containing protein [Gemmatimonadales bacterium]
MALFGIGLLGVAAGRPAREAPRVVANDNTRPAGAMRGDTLVLALVVTRGEWYPEAEDGPRITAEAFAEQGKVPSIPAPLIRVRTGTTIRAAVRNELPDSVIHLIGLGTHPISSADTLHLPPGASAELTFRAGAPGTYLYRAVIGGQRAGAVIGGQRAGERETAGGAFVVDPPGGSPPDRILVMSVIGHSVSASRYRSAIGVNGKSWPHTERFSAAVGDTVRWRVINGTFRPHPMHLHGFYFRIDETGNGITSRSVPEGERRLSVTDLFTPWQTRTIVWSPDRPGNWLFHCHITFHVVPGARLDHDTGTHTVETHSPDPTLHMAGLVVGIRVTPKGGAEPARGRARRLDLFVNQGPRRGLMKSTYSYILQQGSRAPSRDSVRIPGSTIVLTRGEPTDIVVHNRGREPMGIHWHGIELESWSDGVAGWSNRGGSVAPAIVPGGTFTARLDLPRAGTFMYHTHINDLEQVTGGAAGPLLVLEPGEVFDPARDHVYIGMWNGLPAVEEHLVLLVNGDSARSAPKELAAGVTHRFRFINIGPAGILRFTIHRDTALIQWRPRAKDGADLPAGQRVLRRAEQLISVGETYDFDFLPEPGEYELTMGRGPHPPEWRQRLIVR